MTESATRLAEAYAKRLDETAPETRPPDCKKHKGAHVSAQPDQSSSLVIDLADEDDDTDHKEGDGTGKQPYVVYDESDDEGGGKMSGTTEVRQGRLRRVTVESLLKPLDKAKTEEVREVLRRGEQVVRSYDVSLSLMLAQTYDA